MTTQGNGNSVRYNVTMSGATKALLAQLNMQARQAGIGQQFLAALREIGERLRKDPLNFGEPLYRLPALRLLVCQGARSPLLVDFVVHEDRPLVFIRGFKLITQG
jgi:hypothetical protein